MPVQFLFLPSSGGLPGIGGGTYAPGIYEVDYTARTISFYLTAPVAQGEQLVTDRVSFTYLVAASNASALARGSADFLCTGTNDHLTIQNALNGLPTGGGVVMLSEGLFSLAADVVMPSNAMVIGAGRSSILQAAASSSANCLKASGVSHCLVANLTIDGNKANVNQLGIQYTQLSGVYMAAGSDDITIRDCYIHDCYVSGIMANGNCTNIMVANNRMVNNFDNQIYIRAKDTAPYTQCSNSTIVGNICSGGAYSGIQVLGSPYSTITGNVCYSNGPTSAQGDGIGTEGSSYATISGNVCYNNGVQGIHIRFTNEVGTAQISNHVIVSNNICYGHTLTNGDAGGIAIDDTTDVIVSNNLVTGNAYGINVNGGNGNGVNNCVLIGNTVRNNTNLGIRIQPTTGTEFLIEDCYVADNANDNIFVNGAQVIIKNCIIARATGTHSGIHLQTGASGSLIDGCVIYDNTDNAIVIDSPVANVDIRNCTFNNIVGQNQNRALQEQTGAGPTRIANCRILNQKSNLYVFNHAASRYFDELTAGAVIVTANYTCVANDEVVLCNQGAAITVTLPAANGGVIGKVLTVKDKAGNANTNNITVSGAQNIDGAASKIINTSYGVLRIISDGNNWFSI